MDDYKFELLKKKAKEAHEKMVTRKYNYEDIKDKTKDLLFECKKDEHLALFNKETLYTYEEVVEILSEYYSKRCIDMCLRK